MIVLRALRELFLECARQYRGRVGCFVSWVLIATVLFEQHAKLNLVSQNKRHSQQLKVLAMLRDSRQQMSTLLLELQLTWPKSGGILGFRLRGKTRSSCLPPTSSATKGLST
eukprot:662341-Amphidinium_carterae.1